MAVFTGKEPCPNCGSKDNLARYSDGSAHCFGKCGYNEFASDPDGSGDTRRLHTNKLKRHPDMLNGTYTDLGSRKLRTETLKFFGYQLGEYRNQPCHIAPYHSRKGEVVAQHIRLPKDDEGNKAMPWVGEPARIFQLFGQHRWPSGGKMVVVTEGEIDAMTVAQIQNLKWPVVSVPNGAKGSVQAIERASDWLESFDKVVFMFDADDAGAEGAAECAAALTPGKAFIAKLPEGTDPNDLLVANQPDAVLKAMWSAEPYRPDFVSSATDIIQEAMAPVEWGWTMPECLKSLYNWTYGPRPGQVWVGGAGVGIGKTDIFSEMQAHEVSTGHSVAIFHGEQSPPETIQRLAAKLDGVPYFLPDTVKDPEGLHRVLTPHADQIHVYDHRVQPTEWADIAKWVKWVVKVYGCRQVFIDNLTLLSAHADDERRFLDGLLKEATDMASQLGITIHFLSHLTTPKLGKAHEEGGRVEAKQLTGSRAIMRYAHVLWGLERDTQSDDAVVKTTGTLRTLKVRLAGHNVGKVTWLRYDPSTSLQRETEAPPEPKKEEQDVGFTSTDGYAFN